MRVAFVCVISVSYRNVFVRQYGAPRLGANNINNKNYFFSLSQLNPLDMRED